MSLNLPTLHGDLTVEGLKAQALAYLSGAGIELETREGSVANALITGAAYIVWALYQDENNLLKNMYADENSGEMLEIEAARWGLSRKAATKATCTVTLTVTTTTSIGDDFRMVDSTGHKWVVLNTRSLPAGSAQTYNLRAEGAGTDWNIAANTITGANTYVPGLSISSSTAGTGGTDEETDAELYERLCTYREQFPVANTASWYKQLALTVDGIGYCIVTRVSAGSVKLYLATTDLDPATSEQLSAVAAKFTDAVREVCTSVTCEAMEALEFDATVTVWYDTSVTDADTIKAGVQAAIEQGVKKRVAERYNSSQRGTYTHVLNSDWVPYAMEIVDGLDGIESVVYATDIQSDLDKVPYSWYQIPTLRTLTIV